MAYRPDHISFNPILYSGRLTQQFFIHALLMVDNNRMNFFRNNQKHLRVECYQGIYDHLIGNASNNSKNFENKERLGNFFILPSTYIGGTRYMQQNYQDAMAFFRHVDKRPELFITLTCDPNWEEFKIILRNFPPGTTINDIPNIAVRFFYLKFCSLLDDKKT